MIDIPELYAACIIEYVRSLENKIYVGPAYLLVKDTRDRFDLYYNEEVFRLACTILEKQKIISTYSHPGMMAYYRVESDRFAGVFGNVAGTESLRHYRLISDFADQTEYKVLESYNDLGSDWLGDALSTYSDEIASYFDGIGTAADNFEMVPASDRVVSRLDNESAVEQIEDALRAIQSEVQNSNEVGDALGDLKGVALSELKGLSSGLNEPIVRSSNFLSQARSTLGWLAKKCAETSVSELIKLALKLIIGWLS